MGRRKKDGPLKRRVSAHERACTDSVQQLKAMWKDEKAMIIRPHPRLTPEDMAENFSYVLGDWYHGNNDLVELVDRVRRGVKPMASIVLRENNTTYFSERPLEKAAREMGMSCQFVSIRSKIISRRVGVVFQPLTTLSKYYPPDETIARYQAVGVRLGKELFYTPLETFARGLAHEDFQADVKLPLVGMLYGYPVQETLSALGWR